ncbi:MAG: META domain-containing protein [Sphingomonadaceae bacterium]
MRTILVALALGLGACQAALPLGRVPAPSPDFAGGSGQLSGTAWRLIGFQSSDDSIGVLRPSAEARYTVAFEAGGRALLQLDCNRGEARWVKERNAAATGGQLAFSQIETTNARCPQPSLSQRLARDLAYVRSYLIRDGRLYMSLFADGGIYEWEPLPPQ